MRQQGMLEWLSSMVRQSGASNSDLDAALEGSACLGAWSFDAVLDLVAGSAPLFRVLGMSVERAHGAPLRHFLARVHADDRARVEAILRAACGTAGPSIEIEFRTAADGKATSWLRLMGRAVYQPTSPAARLRGLSFDLTERHHLLGSPAQQAQHQINQLADHAIAMKSLVVGLENSPLSTLVDKVAIEIGFELARRLAQATPERRH